MSAKSTHLTRAASPPMHSTEVEPSRRASALSEADVPSPQASTAAVRGPEKKPRPEAISLAAFPTVLLKTASQVAVPGIIALGVRNGAIITQGAGVADNVNLSAGDIARFWGTIVGVAALAGAHAFSESLATRTKAAWMDQVTNKNGRHVSSYKYRNLATLQNEDDLPQFVRTIVEVPEVSDRMVEALEKLTTGTASTVANITIAVVSSGSRGQLVVDTCSTALLAVGLGLATSLRVRGTRRAEQETEDAAERTELGALEREGEPFAPETQRHDALSVWARSPDVSSEGFVQAAKKSSVALPDVPLQTWAHATSVALVLLGGLGVLYDVKQGGESAEESARHLVLAAAALVAAGGGLAALSSGLTMLQAILPRYRQAYSYHKET